MRRPPQLGQNPRPLQEKATSRSVVQLVHRNRAKPPAKKPQCKNARNSAGYAPIARGHAQMLRTQELAPVAEENETRRTCGIGTHVRLNDGNDSTYIPTAVSNRGKRRSVESQAGSTSSGAVAPSSSQA